MAKIPRNENNVTHPGRMRQLVFAIYAFWMKSRLTQWFEGPLQLKDGMLTLRRLRKSGYPLISEFVNNDLDPQDLVFAGMRNKRLNLGHPSMVYFGLFEGDEIVGLFWFSLVGRQTVEPSMALSARWRGKGVLSSLYERHVPIYRKHRLNLRYRVNENNKLVLDYYLRRGYEIDHKEGHLVIVYHKYH